MDTEDDTWKKKPFCAKMKGFRHANVPKSHLVCEYCGLANPTPHSERPLALNTSIPVINLTDEDDEASSKAIHSTSTLGFRSLDITTAQQARSTAIAQEQLKKIRSSRPNVGSLVHSVRPKTDVNIKKEKISGKVTAEKPEEKPDYRILITP
jgi:hypothetical protein